MATRDGRSAPADRVPAVSVPAAVPVDFTITYSYSDERRECPQAVPCLNHYDLGLVSTFAGDIVGSGNQVVVWNNPQEEPGATPTHAEQVNVYNVNATVPGCGAGEFMLVEVIRFESCPNKSTNLGTYAGTWEILPGSGRGVLASVTGTGTSSGAAYDEYAHGRPLTGTVTCS